LSGEKSLLNRLRRLAGWSRSVGDTRILRARRKPDSNRAAEPLKIGMVAPVTGALAESGRYQIQGAKLAVEEINKAGGLLGQPIELVIEDNLLRGARAALLRF
jgi:ABC-type branched-subunit amino acid transport system substrate-binding protein